MVRMQQKRDTAANWTSNDPVLLAGEIGVETDTGKIKVGNGVDEWSVLDYYGGGSGAENLSELNDVSISSPANENILQYSTTLSKWENKALPSIPYALVVGQVADNTAGPSISSGDWRSVVFTNEIIDASGIIAINNPGSGISHLLTGTYDVKISASSSGLGIAQLRIQYEGFSGRPTLINGLKGSNNLELKGRFTVESDPPTTFAYIGVQVRSSANGNLGADSTQAFGEVAPYVIMELWKVA